MVKASVVVSPPPSSIAIYPHLFVFISLVAEAKCQNIDYTLRSLLDCQGLFSLQLAEESFPTFVPLLAVLDSCFDSAVDPIKSDVALSTLLLCFLHKGLVLLETFKLFFCQLSTFYTLFRVGLCIQPRYVGGKTAYGATDI